MFVWWDYVISEYDYFVMGVFVKFGFVFKDVWFFMVFDGCYKLIYVEGGFCLMLFDFV